MDEYTEMEVEMDIDPPPPYSQVSNPAAFNNYIQPTFNHFSKYLGDQTPSRVLLGAVEKMRREYRYLDIAVLVYHITHTGARVLVEQNSPPGEILLPFITIDDDDLAADEDDEQRQLSSEWSLQRFAWMGTMLTGADEPVELDITCFARTDEGSDRLLAVAQFKTYEDEAQLVLNAEERRTSGIQAGSHAKWTMVSAAYAAHIAEQVKRGFAILQSKAISTMDRELRDILGKRRSVDEQEREKEMAVVEAGKKKVRFSLPGEE